MIQRLKLFSLFVFCSLVFIPALALTQSDQLWAEVDITGNIVKRMPKLNYLIEIESFYNFNVNRYQETDLSMGIGYQYLPTLGFWAGYEWDSPDNIDDGSPLSKLWQQGVWNIFKKATLDISARSRMEERLLAGQTLWNVRFRQKFTLKLLKAISNLLTPVIYDEVFFNFNKPVWVTTRTISENRAFIGFDLPTTKQSYLEIGYLNKYEFKQSRNNQMDNVLYVTLNVSTS